MSTPRPSSQPFHIHEPHSEPDTYQIIQYQPHTFIQQMAYMLIRPPRFTYNKFLLKPFILPSKFTLDIHYLPNFQLSVYLPTDKIVDYIILYLHGNSSSRLQVLLILDLLPPKVGIASFDFKGCGNRPSPPNQINFLTLGESQSSQVDIAAKHLKSIGYKVVGWGRSMGSVSLLLSNELQIIIADSPYSSLLKLCHQSKQKVIPWYLKCFAPCFYDCLFEKVKQKVFQLSGMRLEEMQIHEKINKNWQHRQICFTHGQNDDLINCGHSEELYEKFEGRKQYVLFEGTHNSNRPQEVVDACIEFIEESFEFISLKEAEKKSKLLFVRQKNEKKMSEKKLEALNSLRKKKIHLHKIDKVKQDRQQQKRKISTQTTDSSPLVNLDCCCFMNSAGKNEDPLMINKRREEDGGTCPTIEGKEDGTALTRNGCNSPQNDIRQKMR